MHVFAHREKAGAVRVLSGADRHDETLAGMRDRRRSSTGSPTIGLARTTSPKAKATKPGGTASETK